MEFRFESTEVNNHRHICESKRAWEYGEKTYTNDTTYKMNTKENMYT